MKKAIRQIATCLLVLSLLGFQAMVSCLAESAELLSYDDAIVHLGSISLTDADELDLIFRSFRAIGSRYFAPQYMYLTESLLELSNSENVDFNRIEIAITILKSNSTFNESYKADESLSYLPLDSLLDYVQARKLEANGNLQEAYDIYISNQILDSLDRAIAIQYQLRQTSTPEPTSTPTPEATIEELQSLLTAAKESLLDKDTALEEDSTRIAELEELLAAVEAETQKAAFELSELKGKQLFTEGKLSLTETKLAFTQARLAESETALAAAQATIAELNQVIETQKTD